MNFTNPFGLNMRFKLEKTEKIVMHNFTAFQGTFIDTEENNEIRVYANICNLHGPMEESGLYVYAYPFETLYNASAYLLNDIEDEWEMETQLKDAWRKELERNG